MEDLTKQLQQLTPEQVRQVLEEAGHSESILVFTDRDKAESEKRKGNLAFQQQKYELAIQNYSTAIECCSDNAVYYSNRAASYLKLQEFHLARCDLTRAIDLEPTVKAFLRRSLANLQLQNYIESFQDCQSAVAIEPKNKEAWELVGKIQQNLKSTDYRLRTQLQVFKLRLNCTKYASRGNPAPPPLTGHKTCVLQGKIYMIGGRSSRGEMNQVYCLDRNEMYWYCIDPKFEAPTGRSWHSVCPFQHYLVLFGGVSPRGENNELWLYDTLTTKWIDIRAGDTNPCPRSGHAATIVMISDNSAEMYISGGRCRQGVLNDLWRLSLKIDENEDIDANWDLICTQTGSFSARDGHAMCYLSNSRELLIYGGNQLKSEDKLDDVWTFDIKNSQWTEKETHGDTPGPRSYHSMHCINDDFVLVIAGRAEKYGEDNSIHLLEMKSFEWFKPSVQNHDQLESRAWHSSTKIDQEIVIFGGGSPSGPLSDIVRLGFN